MILRTGAIYSIRYGNWKTNFKIYALILFPGSPTTKVHLLNLGAKQLNIIDRTKLVRLINKLAHTPNASKFTGRVLYRIFKAYTGREISKCYRTFFLNVIYQAALINYGLNNESEFTDLELTGQNKALYQQAQNDFQIKALNWWTKRGYDMNKVIRSFAGGERTDHADSTKHDGPSIMKPATKPAYEKPIVTPSQPPKEEETEQPEEEDTNTPTTPTDDGSEFGY